MSNIISREEALSYIERVRNIGLGKKKSLDYISKYIENQQTAYDVDKVVKQLKDYSMWKEFMIYELTHREREIIARAIEIVKGGGVNE